MSSSIQVEQVGLYEGVPIRRLALPDGTDRAEGWNDRAWVPHPSIDWDAVNAAEITPETLSERFGMPLPDVTPSLPACRVRWNDVAGAAEVAFDVWADQPELRWAKRAWRILEVAGLTAYSDEFSRAAVLCRFLVLARLYHDFCDVAWEEDTEPDYLAWSEPLGFDPFILGQMYGRLPDWEPNEGVESWDAVEALAENERGEVAEALVEGFGDASLLYAALWESRDGLIEGYDDGDNEDGDVDSELIIEGMSEGRDPFHPMTEARCAAHEWVTEGCNRSR